MKLVLADAQAVVTLDLPTVLAMGLLTPNSSRLKHWSAQACSW